MNDERPIMSGCVRSCPLPQGGKRDKYTPVRERAKSPIRAIRSGTARLAQQGVFRRLNPICPGVDRVRSRSSLVRALVVLAATILALIVSAIVLPPRASEARPRNRDAVTAPQ